MYRAVDQHDPVIDVLLAIRRDLAAARRFFICAMQAGTIPAEVTTTSAISTSSASSPAARPGSNAREASTTPATASLCGRWAGGSIALVGDAAAAVRL